MVRDPKEGAICLQLLFLNLPFAAVCIGQQKLCIAWYLQSLALLKIIRGGEEVRSFGDLLDCPSCKQRQHNFIGFRAHLKGYINNGMHDLQQETLLEKKSVHTLICQLTLDPSLAAVGLLSTRLSVESRFSPPDFTSHSCVLKDESASSKEKCRLAPF